MSHPNRADRETLIPPLPGRRRPVQVLARADLPGELFLQVPDLHPVDATLPGCAARPARTSAAISTSSPASRSRRRGRTASRRCPGRNTPGDGSPRPTPSRRSWGACARRRARPAATATSSKATSASTRSSTTSATGRSSTASSSPRRRRKPAGASPSSAAASPACPPPTTCAAAATRSSCSRRSTSSAAC